MTVGCHHRPEGQEARITSHHSPAVPFHERHDDDLLTLDEVAEILSTPVNTIRWWRQQDTGPQFFKIGRRLYIHARDLRHWIRRQHLASRPVTSAPKVG